MVSTHTILTIIYRTQMVDNNKEVRGYRLNSYICQALLFIMAMSIVFDSCSLIISNFDPRATLVIQVIDQDTKLELENIEVNLFVEGKVLNRENEDFCILTDAAGRVQFQGLPKGAFSIEVPETDNFIAYDTTFMPRAYVRNSINTLSISLGKKKTVFIGVVMDAQSDHKINEARVELTETSFITHTDSSGKFELEVPHFRRGIQHQLKFSKQSYRDHFEDVKELNKNSIHDMKSIMITGVNENEISLVNTGKIHVPPKLPPEPPTLGGNAGP